MGVGGSIPFIAEFLERYPEASVLVTGVEDPDTRAHDARPELAIFGGSRAAFGLERSLLGQVWIFCGQ